MDWLIFQFLLRKAPAGRNRSYAKSPPFLSSRLPLLFQNERFSTEMFASMTRIKIRVHIRKAMRIKKIQKQDEVVYHTYNYIYKSFSVVLARVYFSFSKIKNIEILLEKTF